MTIKIKSNLTAGIFCILLGIILWKIIPAQIILSSADTGIIDAQFMPKLMAGIIAIAGILLIIQSKIKGDKITEINLHKEGKAFIYIVVLIIYSIMLTKIGFIIASAFLGFMTLVLLQCKNKKYYAIILAIVFLLKLVFQYVLKVPLP